MKLEAPNYVGKEEVPESLLRPGIDDPNRSGACGEQAVAMVPVMGETCPRGASPCCCELAASRVVANLTQHGAPCPNLLCDRASPRVQHARPL